MMTRCSQAEAVFLRLAAICANSSINPPPRSQSKNTKVFSEGGKDGSENTRGGCRIGLIVHGKCLEGGEECVMEYQGALRSCALPEVSEVELSNTYEREY